MRKLFYDRKARFVLMPICAVAFLALISFVVMHLWNCLLPNIMHVSTITFWQAMGIFVLCKILFGFGKGGPRFGGGGRAPWMRQRMKEHFEQMTPEERERFKQKFAKCGPFGRRGFDNDWEDFKEAKPQE